MAGEFRHKDAVAGRVREVEYEDVQQHILNNQAQGDIVYASSAAQLGRLAVGATDTIFSVQGGVPTWRTPADILTDLSGQAGADFSMNSNKITSVTDPASAQDAATKNYVDTTSVLDALFDAHTILYAVADDTPLALAIAALRIVGRKASGNISAMTGAETIALLSGANLDVGAFDVRGATITADGLTSGRVVFAGANGVLSDDSDFTFSVDTLTVTKIAAFELTGAIAAGGQNITGLNSLFMTEQAAADADVEGDGQLWVKDDTPNTLYFTDDAGTDHVVLLGGSLVKHEFHVPFEDPTGQVGNWDVVEINAVQDTHFVFQVPENFESLVNARIVMIPDATETIQWDINVSVAAAGEAYNNDDRSAADQQLAVTSGQLTEVDISGQLSGLVGGDYIAIDFQSDTADLRIIGFEFDYL